MIKLEIKDYCHDCPGFEATVDKYTTGRGGNLTYVRCEHADRCWAIYRHLKKVEEKQNETGI